MNDIQALGLGSSMGFIFKLVGTLVQAQVSSTQSMIEKQGMADSSADMAAKRDGGAVMRRYITFSIVFALIGGLFIYGFLEHGVTVYQEYEFLFFKWGQWKTLVGYVILPEVRQTLLALVGFYFGSSQIK
jgi:hypothetical protein